MESQNVELVCVLGHFELTLMVCAGQDDYQEILTEVLALEPVYCFLNSALQLAINNTTFQCGTCTCSFAVLGIPHSELKGLVGLENNGIWHFFIPGL
jgi:hypothetical protein